MASNPHIFCFEGLTDEAIIDNDVQSLWTHVPR